MGRKQLSESHIDFTNQLEMILTKINSNDRLTTSGLINFRNATSNHLVTNKKLIESSLAKLKVNHSVFCERIAQSNLFSRIFKWVN